MPSIHNGLSFYLNIFNGNFWKVNYSLFFTFKANWKLLNLIGVIMLNMHSTLYNLSFLGSNIEKWNTLFFIYGGHFVPVANLRPIAEFDLYYCIECELYSL